MGSPKTESKRDDGEDEHEWKSRRRFYMGKFEVTQAEYQAVMGKNPSRFLGDKLPVETVNWAEAKEFCEKLSKKEEKQYTLPTEAEWEYACRAGTKTAFHFGDVISTDAWQLRNGNKHLRRRQEGRISQEDDRGRQLPRTNGACTTCTATSGNGARIGTTRTTTRTVRRKIRKGPRRGNGACCAAAPGRAHPKSAARPIGRAIHPMPSTITSAFALFCGRCPNRACRLALNGKPGGNYSFLGSFGGSRLKMLSRLSGTVSTSKRERGRVAADCPARPHRPRAGNEPSAVCHFSTSLWTSAR